MCIFERQFRIRIVRKVLVSICRSILMMGDRFASDDDYKYLLLDPFVQSTSTDQLKWIERRLVFKII